ERYGRRITQGYGLTECSPFAAWNHDVEVRVGSVGTPNENVEMKVVDGEGREVADGELGEALINGPNVREGCFGNPQANAEASRSRPARTPKRSSSSARSPRTRRGRSSRESSARGEAPPQVDRGRPRGRRRSGARRAGRGPVRGGHPAHADPDRVRRLAGARPSRQVPVDLRCRLPVARRR